jgi:DNA (cytosine-5)-methyltransferase 1
MSAARQTRRQARSEELAVVEDHVGEVETREGTRERQRCMNELSLFTGAGGGLLGTHHLLGFNCIGYVEWESYCQQVIAARIKDGYLPVAPIFGDIRQFVQSGAAREYRGFTDVVSAGFPCPGFSIAGLKRAGLDERNMWPATRDCIRIIRPRSIVLENVPGLLTCGYGTVVICQLAEMGYVGSWGCIPGSGVDAPHLRERIWIIAHAEGGLGQAWERRIRKFRQWPTRGVSYAALDGDNARGWVEMATEFRRMDDGLAHAVDRVKAAGNGQIPRVVAAAWQLLR